MSPEEAPPLSVSGQTSEGILIDVREAWFSYDRRTPVLRAETVPVAALAMISLLRQLRHDATQRRDDQHD